jgi:hypothetical protein
MFVGRPFSQPNSTRRNIFRDQLRLRVLVAVGSDDLFDRNLDVVPKDDACDNFSLSPSPQLTSCLTLYFDPAGYTFASVRLAAVPF